MLDHVSVIVSDLSRRPVLGRGRGRPRRGVRGAPGRHDRLWGAQPSGDDGHTDLSVRQSTGAVVVDNRHWCLRAPSRAAFEAFHAVGLADSGRCDGPPGLRLDDHPTYCAAFLLDLDSNHIEAACHRVQAER